MTITYHGNAVDIKWDVGDQVGDYITLIDGYSIEEMYIINNTGIYGLYRGMPIATTTEKLYFPSINSRNPNRIAPFFNNTKEQRLSFLITKFGKIPDVNYFDKAFEPILVTGDDGKEYKVIPSDQFK